jgi:hypothetical protein
MPPKVFLGTFQPFRQYSLIPAAHVRAMFCFGAEKQIAHPPSRLHLCCCCLACLLSSNDPLFLFVFLLPLSVSLPAATRGTSMQCKRRRIGAREGALQHAQQSDDGDIAFRYLSQSCAFFGCASMATLIF